jgi:hypothetical protein
MIEVVAARRCVARRLAASRLTLPRRTFQRRAAKTATTASHLLISIATASLDVVAAPGDLCFTPRWIHIRVSILYSTRMKDAQLRLRVEKDLREDFGRTCRLQGKKAAEVLRSFMREYVMRESGGLQGSLLDGTPETRAHRRKRGSST